MHIYRAFLIGLIFIAAAAAQPCGTSVSSAPTYKLAGRVVGASGEWIQTHGPLIIDSAEKILFVPCSFDVHSGAFSFGPLPAGTYTLQVGGISEQHAWINTTHRIVLSSDETDVQLELRSGLSLPIRIRKGSPHPVGPCWWSGWEITPADCSDHTAVRVSLVPVDSKRMPYLSPAGVLKDPANFTIDGIEPGKYVVQVESPRYPMSYVQSVRSGNIDLLHEPLPVPEYGTVLPIEIVLRDDFARLTVHTNRKAVQPLIVLLPEGVLLPVPQLPPQQLEGEELSVLVAPGDYSVFAFDGARDRGHTDPELLAKYAARAPKVTVSANETRSISPDVIHIEE